MTFSTRAIAAETGDAVSHQTVAVFLRGESVSPASRTAIEAALAALDRRREMETAKLAVAEQAVAALRDEVLSTQIEERNYA